MSWEREKVYSCLPLFDPSKGEIIREPETSATGYWVGAPAVIWDASRRTYLLTYRRRRPRDEHPDRGYVSVVAESKDGIDFEDVWQVEKGELESTSIEKTCLIRSHEGRYRLYVSYVDSADSRWRIDVIEADAPDAFDVSKRAEVFTADRASRFQETPVEGVKDPNVYVIGHLYYMFFSFAEDLSANDERRRRAMHETADVYNTGLLTAPSGVATSTDGIHFRWHGKCLPVGDDGEWDGYQARLNSVIRHDGLWYGLYDGSASHRENYDEKFGLAQSFDLESWRKVSISGPLITVPWMTGSVRYTDCLRVKHELRYYYEMVRPDGAHELRCAVVPAG